MGWNNQRLLAILFFGLYACSPPRQDAGSADPAAGLAALDQLPAPSLHLTGRELAQMYCQSCHLFPEPALLDKETWVKRVLPNMALRLGVQLPGANNPYGGLSYQRSIGGQCRRIFLASPCCQQ